ncbi:hypothetical protein Plhal703r1_c25g0105251 [Plasmopara halstedii]
MIHIGACQTDWLRHSSTFCFMFQSSSTSQSKYSERLLSYRNLKQNSHVGLFDTT